LTANALVWNPSTNYAIGQNAISPTDFQTYRRRVAGVSATDPASDATNWAAVAAVPDGSVTAAKLAPESVTTAKLAPESVTFAKLQNIATAVMLGRSTAGTGDVEALTALPEGVTAPASSIAGALNASGSAPLFACRAWVNFNGQGTVAIRASGNVSSITDNGTGTYTVNFTTAMPDANFSAVAAHSTSGYATRVDAYATSTVRVTIFFETAPVDASAVSVAVFR
jgi:hypothetical protein